MSAAGIFYIPVNAEHCRPSAQFFRSRSSVNGFTNSPCHTLYTVVLDYGFILHTALELCAHSVWSDSGAHTPLHH